MPSFKGNCPFHLATTLRVEKCTYVIHVAPRTEHTAVRVQVPQDAGVALGQRIPRQDILMKPINITGQVEGTCGKLFSVLNTGSKRQQTEDYGVILICTCHCLLQTLRPEETLRIPLKNKHTHSLQEKSTQTSPIFLYNKTELLTEKPTTNN